MVISLGAGLAFALLGLAHWLGFDRDRSFFPTVLMVIAGYYVLFAVMAQQAIAFELLAATVFCAVAVIGYLRSQLWVAAGVLVHGVFDVVHPHTVANAGVPDWWPALCLGFDAVLGIWIVALHWQRRSHPHDSSKHHETEIDRA
ncbi:hypothetical protein GYB61_10970 [bacterium]|nr:hypothetical protein [bacterium]